MGVIRHDFRDGLSVLGVDGSGIVNGRFVVTASDAREALSNAGAEQLDSIGKGIRGSLTLYLYDPRAETAYVLVDPLGGSLTYSFEAEGIFSISSHVEQMADLLSGEPVSPQKSLAYAMSQLATGMYGGVVESSYEGTKLLPPASYVSVRSNGHQIHRYDCVGVETDAASMSWSEAVERARFEIIENVRVTAEYGAPRQIAHLTGGMDSRLVLGAALASRTTDAFAFNTRGSEHTRDKIVARALSSVFGLQMTDDPGLSEAVPPGTREDSILGPLRFTGGLAVPPVHGGMYPSGTVTLAGGYGEFYRSYSRPQDYINTRVSAREGALTKWGSYAFGEQPAERLFTDELVEGFLLPIEESMEFAAAKGLGPDTWVDIYYRRRRNRHFVGEISRAWSRRAPRFDPLYSTFVSEYLLRRSFDERVSAAFQFDVMAALEVSLPQYPFDTSRFSPTYLALRGQPTTREFPQGILAPHVNDWSSRKPAVAVERYHDGREVLPQDKSTASRYGISTPAAAAVRVASRNVVRLMQEMPGTELDRTIKPSVLHKIRGRAWRHEWSRRALFTIERGLAWYLDGPGDR
ncbi:hypothetical protein [Agrococcus sp. Ld7]|uniref:hypothetical protein n=1 Tax=Agrococcus sp. Ld7 TaxID=649148 RepID=UPI003868C5DB